MSDAVKIEDCLGLDAIDMLTGYDGVITAYCIYENGGKSVLVESIDKLGQPIEAWFDIKRIKVAIPKDKKDEKAEMSKNEKQSQDLCDILNNVLEDFKNGK